LTEEDVIKTVGSKFTSLEYLELSLEVMEAEDAVDELKKHLPGLRGVIEDVFNYGDNRDSRVMKIVKFKSVIFIGLKIY
jgi:hypothetical protein